MSSPTSLGHFVWHDCLTPDIDRALSFFSKLTDWQVLDQTSPNVGRYPIIKSQGRPIAGMLEMPKFLQTSGIPPYWTGYVHSELESAAASVPTLGGQMFTMPTKSAMGTSFVFTDVGGAVLAAYEPSDSFTVPSSSHQSEIVWQRLYCANGDASAQFYKTLFGWRASAEAEGARTIYDRSGVTVGDIGSKATWIDADTWVYFIGVADLSSTTTAVEERSGSIVLTTQVNDQPALVTKDSQGGIIGFVEC